MGKILILNGSPRAPKSNSKAYAALFAALSPSRTDYRNITKANHLELCRAMEDFTDLLLVFPLYADGIPVTLLNFLKTLEHNPPSQKPTVSVLINCGFFEPEQNDVAVEMVRLFCARAGYPFGSVLKIGSGEAILTTPFAALVRGKIRKLAAAIEGQRCQTLQVTMPIPKKWFVKASTSYWKNYGKRNGITAEQMASMEIEPS